MNGVDLNTVRELLGHTDMKMTLRYAHLAPETKMRAVETLDLKNQEPLAKNLSNRDNDNTGISRGK
jgi:1-deoxy-D-xylulose 5-phosphate reductoisomerase